jgi:tellurite resistance protein
MEKPTHQEAMIYLMVIMSASDRDMRDEELSLIGALVRNMPVFDDFDQSRVLEVAQRCQQLLQEEAGLSGLLDTIRDAVPAPLHETAYALAVDVAAADLIVGAEETRMLDLVKARLALDPIAVAAIERAAAIRYRTM